MKRTSRRRFLTTAGVALGGALVGPSIIIRKMGDDSCWALPYWNWSSPTERQLPAPFLDTGSELYTPNRSAGMNGGGSLPSSDVSYSSSFAQTNFTTTSLIIQGTPHGAV